MIGAYHVVADAIYHHLTGKLSRNSLEEIILHQKVCLSETVFNQLRDADTSYERVFSLFEKDSIFSVALDHTKEPLLKTRCTLNWEKFIVDKLILQSTGFECSASYHFHPNGNRSAEENHAVDAAGSKIEYYDWHPSSLDIYTLIKTKKTGLIGCANPVFHIRAWIPVFYHGEDRLYTNQHCIVPLLKHFPEMKADLNDCLGRFISTVSTRIERHRIEFAFLELPISKS